MRVTTWTSSSCARSPTPAPGRRETFAIPSFAGQIARIEAGLAEPVIKVGNLAARRDYSDVRCVVDAYARLLERRGEPRVVNVATRNRA